MKWFGESWGAGVCIPESHLETPTGEICGGCREPIEAHHQGVVMPLLGGPKDPETIAYHRRCMMRALGLTSSAH